MSDSTPRRCCGARRCGSWGWSVGEQHDGPERPTLVVVNRWENVGWLLGSVVKMNTRGGKTTFDISYPDDADAIGRHELGLDTYVVGGAGGAETCPIGTWAVVIAKGVAPPV